MFSLVSPSGSVSVDNFPTLIGTYGTSVSFTCTSRGGPGVEYRWVRDDAMAVDTSDLPTSLSNVVGTTAVLTIDNVNGSSGGDYSCVAFNEAGSDVVNVTLYVSLEILQDPEENVYTSVGESVVLSCLADSFPAPEYQWQYTNETQFEDIIGETNTTLVINPVMFADFGSYRCAVNTPIINQMDTSGTALITGNNMYM